MAADGGKPIVLKPWTVAIALTAIAGFAVVGILWWHPRADEFLGTADFEGAPIPPGNVGAPVGQTTYNGVMTFTNVNRGLVGKLLPSGYLLAKNISFWHKSEHPVALLFGDQTDGVQFLGNLAVPVTAADRLHYTEMILAIPFVQKVGQPGWHTYVVRMYLDNMVAVTGGNLRYGYAKEFACLDWTGRDVKIWQKPLVCSSIFLAQRKDRLTGDFEFSGIWRNGNAALVQLRNLKDMVAIWGTRILGRKAGASVCSYFDWNFDRARVARAVTTYSFESAFRSDMTAWPGLGDLKSVSNGAAAVRGLRWRLASPFAC